MSKERTRMGRQSGTSTHRQHANPFLKKNSVSPNIAAENNVQSGENNATWLFTILQSAMDPIISIDSGHNIIYLNPAAEVLFGYRSEELLGKPLNILIPERFRSDHTEQVKQFAKAGKSIRHMGDLGTVRGLRNDGTEIPLEVSISHFEADGESFATAILRDVTKKSQNERELAQSKETYQQLFDSMSDPVFVQDKDGKFLDINSRALETYGYSKSDFVGNTFDLVNAGNYEDMERMYRHVRAAFNGSREIFEWKCRGKNDQIIINEFILTKGSYFGQEVVIATARDITERKQIEEQVRIFEDIIKNVNDSITIASLDGTLLFVNQAFCQTYGYPTEEILGRKISALISPNNPDDINRRIFTESIKNGWSGEVLMLRKDGTEFPVYLSTTAIRDTDGNPSVLVGVSLDMTKQKHLEEQVIQSHKMESLRILVEGIAHNFNNILAIITGYASLSQREKTSREKIHHNLDLVLGAADRGAALVKQLFTFSAKYSAHPQNISLHEVIEEIAKIAREMFPKDITVDLGLDSSDPFIAADRNDLQQAIINVMINACEAIPSGGTITVQSRVVGTNHPFRHMKSNGKSDTEYVCLSIADSGTGIAAEIKDRIFEPFFTTKDIGKGMGLGLTITYGIIERYNGFIDVESKPGTGTTVLLYLPLVKNRKGETEPETEVSPGQRRGSETILIIEDEDPFRRLLRNTLSDIGYSVLTASDGETGLDQYFRNRSRIGLLLLDIGLPKINGLKILEQIRADNPALKTIIITGYDTAELLPSIERMNVNRIIQKPVDLDNVLANIRTVLLKEGGNENSV